MPKTVIDCDIRDFDTSKFSELQDQIKTLNIDWVDLIHASVMIGKTGYADVIKYGLCSIYECVFRVALVRANLKIMGSLCKVRSI